MTITLAMIVRDEEGVLGRCLESAANLFDELVVLDTGSEDGTVAVAKSFGAKVYEAAWRDDFSYARNLAFSKANGDYIFWLDADDVIPPESRARFAALRRRIEEERPETVMCLYRSGDLLYERERLVLRCDDAKWRGHVHECIAPFGKIIHDGFTVLHLASEKDRRWRNLRIYEKWAGEEQLSGRDLFYYGRELFYHGLYVQAEAVLRKMLGGDGWYVNKIAACEVLARSRQAAGDTAGALDALLESFRYGEPRAYIVCEIGEIFKRERRYREAAFWFETALSCRDHTLEGDFEQPACRALTPLLELVWLYHVLGEHVKSLEMHKKSEALAPDHPSVIHNKNYFGE